MEDVGHPERRKGHNLGLAQPDGFLVRLDSLLHRPALSRAKPSEYQAIGATAS